MESTTLYSNIHRSPAAIHHGHGGRSLRLTPPRASSSSSSSSSSVEVRVCVNRTCARQGSREILDTLSSLAPPRITVSSCGCLGRCGAGPNLAVIPPGAVIGHCGTAARAAKILAEMCRLETFDAEKSLRALALRKLGDAELEKGKAAAAESLLSQAIDLKPTGGLQFIYRSRSAANLALGRYANALEDAEEASHISPKYSQAYICQGDAFLAMEELDAAEKAFSTALLIDPSIRRSKSFKARVAKLQEKLVAPNVS